MMELHLGWVKRVSVTVCAVVLATVLSFSVVESSFAHGAKKDNYKTQKHSKKSYKHGYKKDKKHTKGKKSKKGKKGKKHKQKFEPVLTCSNNGACSSCEGGLNSLTLQYNGAEKSAIVYIEDKKGGVLVPGQTVLPGDEISFSSLGGDRFVNQLLVYVNGDFNAEIHVSCSVPIGPGTVWGDFVVIDANSVKGGAVCADENDDENEGGSCKNRKKHYQHSDTHDDSESEQSCECKGGVTSMTLRYLGGPNYFDPSIVEVIDGDNNVLFGPLKVAIGEDIAINGLYGNKLDHNVSMKVDGMLDTIIHTSCSKPVEPGTQWGVFQIREAISKDNGPICGCLDEPGDFGEDFGDAPASYGTPSHTVTPSGPYAGVAPDTETGPAGFDGSGDDTTDIDDEGNYASSFLCGASPALNSSPSMQVNVTGGGFLNMWVDWNRDGVFDSGNEHIAVDQTPDGSGIVTITSSVPNTAVLGPTFARVRVSSTAGLGADGSAMDGEVEDCALTITGAPEN